MPDRKNNNKAVYINTAATTVVFAGKCVLKRIVVNTTAAGTIEIYDHATAASGMPLGILASSVAAGVYEYDVPMTSGIVVKTGAASNITVVYEEWDPK